MDSIDARNLQPNGTDNCPKLGATLVSESSAKTRKETIAVRRSAPMLWRLFDIICSIAILVILLPFLVVIFVLIKMETAATAINVSERFSLKSGKFNALNFRCSALIDGKRVPTRIGNALKSTGIDQLPLLFNVLKGDISLSEAFYSSWFQAETLDNGAVINNYASDVRSFATLVGTNSFLGGSSFFWATKRLFDVVVSLVLLPVLAIVAIVLLILNPFWNQGRLIFVQTRMGRYCRPFKAIKFRSMSGIKTIARGPDDPVETDRITALGMFLRKCRLDELPQILNVLMGQMSLIGPRPDYYVHATSFIKSVPGYQERHLVRPGISGLAQINLGYAEGTDATCKKVNADHKYIRDAGFAQEATLVVKTIVTVLSRAGS